MLPGFAAGNPANSSRIEPVAPFRLVPTAWNRNSYSSKPTAKKSTDGPGQEGSTIERHELFGYGTAKSLSKARRRHQSPHRSSRIVVRTGGSVRTHGRGSAWKITDPLDRHQVFFFVFESVVDLIDVVIMELLVLVYASMLLVLADVVVFLHLLQ